MGYEQDKNLGMFDAYIDSESIYFSNNTFNALICYEKKSGICTCLKNFDEELPMAKGLHKKVELFNGCLFFFPNFAKGISRYNLMTGEMTLFKCNGELLECAEVLIIGEVACLVPKSIEQTIYLFNMKKCCYIDKKVWNKKIKSMVPNGSIQIKNAINIGHAIWLFGALENYLIEIAMDTDECRIFYLRSEDQICAMTAEGKNLWLVLRQDQSVIKWNKDEGVLERIPLFQDKATQKEWYFLYYEEEKLFVLPAESKKIFIYDAFNGMKEIFISTRKRVKDGVREKLPLCFRGVMYGENMYLLPHASDKMYIYNINTDEVTERELLFGDMLFYYKIILNIPYFGIEENTLRKTVREYNNFSLIDLIHTVDNQLHNQSEIMFKSTNCGRRIYEEINER